MGHETGGESVSAVIERARSEGREVLLETESLGILSRIGIAAPVHRFVRDAGEAATAELDSLAGERLVVKVVSPEILHKSDIGGVAVIRSQRTAVIEAIETMQRRLAGRPIAGYLVSEFVDFDRSLGGELLLGMRWTPDFGPVVTLGPGGVYAEHLAGSLRTGRDTAILSPRLTPASRIDAILGGKAITPVITGQLRGQQPRITQESLRELIGRFLEFAGRYMPDQVAELEVNPLVLTDSGPLALDALVKLGRKPRALPPDRPLWKLEHLLEPRSIAVIGVSRKLNPGHIILNNIIDEGFDREKIYVVKTGSETIEGCRCYPEIGSLPEKVDLTILSVDASQVPTIVEEIIATRKAESMIVIPGGLGERSGTKGILRRIDTALHEARASDWQGPLINGANCLGIRSRPGRYNTLFIPKHKMPARREQIAPVAVVSQSGAFIVAKLGKFHGMDPKYLISIGNQADLTVGDYLTYLKDDPEIAVYACYVEGFRDLDGARWLEAASEITAGGRTVVLYRGGRSPSGAQASASHTASVAGDYAVTRELARAAGVIVVDELADFEDLLQLFTCLKDKRVAGWRIGAISNAGYECVAMADNLGPCKLGPFGDKTAAKLETLLAGCRLEEIVQVRNPLDVTPILPDAPYEEAVRAILLDDSVDVGLIGCVPLTGALTTLAAGDGHGEDILQDDSIVSRLIRLRDEIEKPWVAVVEGGPLFDPMALALAENGIPTFRTADRALRMLQIFCHSRLA